MSAILSPCEFFAAIAGDDSRRLEADFLGAARRQGLLLAPGALFSPSQARST
jgi:hypothetical protein